MAPDAQAPGGYGDRFEDDAFDYPSLSAAHAWSADPAPAAAAGKAVAAPPAPTEESGTGRGRAREAGGWQQAAVRHHSALTAAAALVVLGGFGFALSTVSDTVSSNPTPGGTAQVSAPKSPTAQPLPSEAAVSAAPPGGAASTVVPPPQTSLLPGTGDGRDRDAEHGWEEQGREDGDDADD